MAYLSDRMRTLAASGCPKAAELLEKADELDKALAKAPSDLTTVLERKPCGPILRGSGFIAELKGVSAGWKRLEAKVIIGQALPNRRD